MKRKEPDTLELKVKLIEVNIAMFENIRISVKTCFRLFLFSNYEQFSEMQIQGQPPHYTNGI